MAYKCKSCGYRFKPSDSDLCPQCFTARDDIDCFGIGDGSGRHNHFKDSSGGDDFIAEQLREEARATGDELREQISSYTDSFKRSFDRNETPPNTYQRVSYPNAQQSRNTAYRQSAVYPQPQYAQPGYEMDAPRQKRSGCSIAAFIIFALLFFRAPIMSLIKNFSTSESEPRSVVNEDRFDGKKYGLKAKSGKITGEITDPYVYTKKPGFEELANRLKEGTIDAVPELIEKVWYVINCDITLSEGCKADDFTLIGYDRSGNELFSWKMLNDFGTGNKLYKVPLLTTAAMRYELLLSYTDSSGEKGTLVFKPELAKLAQALDENPVSIPDPSAYSYNYEYKMGAYETNMTDTEGSGYKLKMSGSPHELTNADIASADLAYSDQKASTFLKLCPITVTKEVGAFEISEIAKIKLIGFDADGVKSYSYNSVGYNDIPISGIVKDYELFIGVIDTEGYDHMMHFTFTSNDLYDSINELR